MGLCVSVLGRHVQVADIWSCGVMLYVMLVGAYPFERPEDKTDSQKLQKMIQVSGAAYLDWMHETYPAAW